MRSSILAFASAILIGLDADTVIAQQQSDPYARYTMPSQCVGARYRAESRFWRDKRPDTVAVGPLGRTLQPATIAEVARCVARFDADRVAKRDLLGLGFAYLLANQPTDAERAFTRLLRLSEKKDVGERAWVLRQIINVYTEVAPTRLSDARSFIRKLDALGPDVAVDRLLAHLDLAGRAKQADSVRFLEEEIKAGISASRDITVDSVRKQRAYSSSAAYIGMGYVKMRRSIGPNMAVAFSEGDTMPSNIAADLDQLETKASYKALGKPAPMLQATRWFNGRPNESYPAKNKVTLVVFVSTECDECYSNYAVLQRLAKRFGTDLDIVSVMRTVGYFRGKLRTAEEEMTMSQKYLLDDLKLPGTLGIWQADMGHRDDGRLKVLTNPNEDAYKPSFQLGVPAFVVDKRGTMRFIGSPSLRSETTLQNVIGALLTE